MPTRLLCLSLSILAVTGCAKEAAPDGPRAHEQQKAAHAAVTGTPHPGVHHAPACSAGDLVARFRRGGDGAGGHAIALLDFRNVSPSPCLLSGHPRRVTLTEPGHRPVTATDGSFFPVEPSEPMEHGEVTSLGLETDTYCNARPTGGPGGPKYHEVAIALRGGVLRVATPRAGLDVGCGVHLTTFTTWQ